MYQTFQMFRDGIIIGTCVLLCYVAMFWLGSQQAPLSCVSKTEAEIVCYRQFIEAPAASTKKEVPSD